MGLFGILRKGSKTEEQPLRYTSPAEEPEFLKEMDRAQHAEGMPKDNVEPELALWLSNGTTASGLKELVAALRKMKAADYKEHVSPERNDIAEWVKEVLNNESLAGKLRRANGRLEAAKAVEKEISKKKPAKKTARTIEKQETEQPLPETNEKAAAETAIPDQPATPPKTEKKRLMIWPFRKAKQEIGEAPAMNAQPEPVTIPPEPDFEPEPTHAKWEEQPAQAEEMPVANKEAEEPPKERIAKTTGRKNTKPKRRDEETPAEAEDFEMELLEKKEAELEKAEKELDEEEEGLNSKRLTITRRRYDLIKQRGNIERQKFEAFMKRQKMAEQSHEARLQQHEVTSEGTLPWATDLPDLRLATAYGKARLQELLEEAKMQINQNNYEQALKALQEVQAAFNIVYIPPMEKKQLQYEILEVEADLKLASLK